jgi:hypothetical protein
MTVIIAYSVGYFLLVSSQMFCLLVSRGLLYPGPSVINAHSPGILAPSRHTSDILVNFDRTYDAGGDSYDMLSVKIWLHSWQSIAMRYLE